MALFIRAPTGGLFVKELRLAAFLIRAPPGGFFDMSSDWRPFC